MNLKIVSVAVGITFAISSGTANAAETAPTYKVAAERTAHGYTVNLVCDDHEFNDHYWRVGFCSGNYQQYPTINFLPPAHKTWSAHDDAFWGYKARIALAEGTPPTLYGWNIVK